MAKRNYPDNGFSSVTTVIGVLRKIGLEEWFKRTPYHQIIEESNKGKYIGTQIHDAIQCYIETGTAKTETEHPEQVTNALKSFMAFRRDYPNIELKWAEMKLTSKFYGFNGTIDCIGESIGEGIILDWKTSQAKDKERPDIYDEYKIQVSAYVRLHNEVNEANIDKAVIVSIAKDKITYSTYAMVKEEIDEYFENMFLPALKICNFQKRKSKMKG